MKLTVVLPDPAARDRADANDARSMVVQAGMPRFSASWEANDMKPAGRLSNRRDIRSGAIASEVTPRPAVPKIVSVSSVKVVA